jgi:hypothetical protein
VDFKGFWAFKSYMELAVKLFKGAQDFTEITAIFNDQLR